MSGERGEGPARRPPQARRRDDSKKRNNMRILSGALGALLALTLAAHAAEADSDRVVRSGAGEEPALSLGIPAL